MNRRISLRAPDEKTEIFLTDYLDGKLSPDRRADLDAYLAENPAQQQVLTELLEQRGKLQALPSELPPPEILDAVTYHLERLALVQDAESLPLPPRRRARPHLAAIAATLLLAAGLATALYFVLAPKNPPFTLATHTPPVAQPPPAPLADLERAETSPPLARGGPAPDFARARPSAPSPSAATPDAERSADPPNPPLPGMALSQSNRLPPTPAAAPPRDFGAIAATALDDAFIVRTDLNRMVAFPSANPAATRARIETLLRDGGWSFADAASIPLHWVLPGPGPAAPMSPLSLPPSTVAPLVVRVEPDQVDALLAALASTASTEIQSASRAASTKPPDTAASRTLRILLHFPTRP